MTPHGLQIHDLYLGASIDVEVSSGDDEVSTLDALVTKQKNQLTTTLRIGEPLQLSQLLLTRSAPMRRDRPILLSLIGLLQLILVLADAGTSVPRPFPSGNKHFLHTADPIVR
jgi:hypothetical protein